MFKNSLFSFSSCGLSHLILTTWLYSCCLYSPLVSCKCLENQKSLLLELKNNLTFGEHVATNKVVGWNQSTDCCQWSGVECDHSNGRVIGLDLSETDITGGINNSSSLFRLQYLRRLNLAYNHMQGEMPSAFGKLTSLTYFNLSGAGFSGQVPIEISQLVRLIVLDISQLYTGSDDTLYMENPNLATIIQNMTNLKELYLNGVNNSAMGNRWCHALSSSLPHLEVLSMAYCNLRGEIHKSFSNLKHLSKINLDLNYDLTGQIPESFGDFTNLTSLSMIGTTITGTVPLKLFQIPTLRTLKLSSTSKLQGTLPEFSKNGSLEELSLSGINFSGPLTSSITNLNRLRYLQLDNCRLHGSIPSSIGNLNRLEWLELYSNQFEGPIPKSLFQLKELEFLHLSSNRLNGTLQLAEFLHSFKKLTALYLSNNNLSIKTDGCNVDPSFPQLQFLELASCNLHSIPKFLKNQTQLFILDLSVNRLTGTIPSWIWRVQRYLNLSNNHFVELEPLPTQSRLESIDLHSNNLQGDFSILLSETYYLDCSNNNFTSIHLDFGYVSNTGFISFSRNSLYGNIPTSLCNATEIGVLNLEYNHLSGAIPDCLLAMPQLYVLNLRRNNLSGDIPDNFRKNCSLQTLQVNENNLQGKIPPSLAHCRPLKVLDLGYNQLYDTFPCHLESLSNLHVLILRSNSFHGTMTCLKGSSIWPLLQIVDLASNHFSGNLSTLFLLKWKSMIFEKTAVQSSEPDRLESYVQDQNIRVYYQNTVAITSKGLAYDQQYILTIFCSIDVSDNAFHGELPAQLGHLNALKVLNVSHNMLSGRIPPSLGNLSQIESLDLSYNTFSGRIPPQLANLNFLGYMKLSYNRLSGKIPTGTQLQSFGVSSYEGNQGLYGPPLKPIKSDPTTTYSSSSKGSSWSFKNQREWMLRGAEVGFPVGITVFLGPLLYIKRYREWYCKHLHGLVMKIMRKEDGPRGRRRNRHLRQRS